MPAANNEVSRRRLHALVSVLFVAFTIALLAISYYHFDFDVPSSFLLPWKHSKVSLSSNIRTRSVERGNEKERLIASGLNLALSANVDDAVIPTGKFREIVGTKRSKMLFSSQQSTSISDYEPRCNDGKIGHLQFQYTNEDYEAPEPFAYLHNCCDDCNAPINESPDPLVSVKWNSNSEDIEASEEGFIGTPLQIYRIHTPVKQWTIPSEGCLVSNGTKNTNLAPRMTIVSNCTIVMDWGSERAAWFEVLSKEDLTEDNPGIRVTASISEYNRPYPGKTLPLTKYGRHTYRLETNDELYEGVRFTFLHVEFLECPRLYGDHSKNSNTTSPVGTIGKSLTIDDISVVSKIKPIEYTGNFQSSNPLLTKAYYWGAYGVRLNIEQTQLNSVLIERGDRVAIQGDGHPTIATVLDVFYGHETKRLLKNVLNDTDNAHKRVVDDVIMAYPLYWCLSAMDYYWRTFTSEDEDFVRTTILQDIPLLLDKRIDDFLDPNLDITWFGWDDRVGNGWCFHSKNDVCTREGLLAFAGLLIRVCNDFCSVLRSMMATKDDPLIFQLHIKYHTASIQMTEGLRRVPEYPSGFGVHAAANAINAFVATQGEIRDYWMGTTKGNQTLNNAVTICSFSQFNQYWILQAYGNIEGGLEHALKSVELCWGPMMKLSTGGCFWELSSPEWLRFMEEGDQAPHLPSYCHPWASGVTPWLSRLLGGLNPLLPGYQEFVAMPYVSEAYPNVTTSTLTPHGTISVTAQLWPLVLATTRNDNTHKSYMFHASVDTSVSGVFGIRRGIAIASDSFNTVLLNVDTLFMNGVPIREDAFIDTKTREDTMRSNGSCWYELEENRKDVINRMHLEDISGYRSKEYIFFRIKRADLIGVHGGSFVITATYDFVDTGDIVSRSGPLSIGTTGVSHRADPILPLISPYSPFPMPNYAAFINNPPLDRESQGDGLRTYGADGYVLLGYDKDVTLTVENEGHRLPPYVQTVRVRQHGYPGWVDPDAKLVGFSDTDPVYLPLDDNNEQHGKRVLGRIGIDDTGGGDINCILVDVTMKGSTGNTSEPESQPYSLSIYFVAGRSENRHAIRVMDGETLEVIAPTTVVQDYEGGVWWTVHYHRSIRLKMMDIEGIQLSAVAFATPNGDEL